MAIRIEVEIPEEKVYEFDGMQEALNLSSREELFNHAIGILDVVIRQRKLGRSITFIDDTTQERYRLSQPALNAIKPQAQVPLKEYIVTLCRRAVKWDDSKR